MNATRNRLAGESSTYLRQHADNPVHWQPWDEQALTLARSTGKPILLSVGYSACHWCHVMAHESFEDPATAAVMNEHFINIKVDREERPDLDQIYQKAHMLIQQHPGGWPLTMFLTPGRQIPFFGGTYFPPASRQGLPGFRDVLERVAAFYAERSDQVEQEGASIVAALGQLDATGGADSAPPDLDAQLLETAEQAVLSNFDADHGGFGAAPKFPHTGLLSFLFDQWQATRRAGEEDDNLRYAVMFTLERMALGGVYDQLGGGFYRYSVDDSWNVPHFEKMLYDNGPLLGLYARAARIAEDERFDLLARETGAFVIRELQGSTGGYHAALDADSNGDEGAYYLWDAEEVRRIVGDETTLAVVARTFALDHSPNVTDRWHLRVAAHPQDVAEALGLSAQEVAAHLARGRSRLLQARVQRPAPTRDDKVLTSWNGLMIDGMATAARFTGEGAFAESATAAADFLRAAMWDDGRLLAVYTQAGGPRFNAYLDDYVFLALGLLGLLQVRWRSEDLHFAIALADAVLARFEDTDNGGFFFTSHDHEPLVHRPRPFEDDSTPSGNGAAVSLFARLGHLLGRPDYLAAAQRTLRAGWGRLERHPQACGALVTGLRHLRTPPPVVVLRGPEAELEAWQYALTRGAEARHAMDCEIYAIPAQADALPEGLALRAAPQAPQGVLAYVCQGTKCGAPVTDLRRLVAALRPDTDTQDER